MADLFIVGQFYGVDSITAVANGSQVLHMLTVIIVGLAMGQRWRSVVQWVEEDWKMLPMRSGIRSLYL